MIGTFKSGIEKLPAFQQFLRSLCGEDVTLDIHKLEGTNTYQCSILKFNNIIKAVLDVKDLSPFFVTDFSHQCPSFGAYGNVWALVTSDPEGKHFFLFSILFFITKPFSHRSYSAPCTWTSLCSRVCRVLDLVFTASSGNPSFPEGNRL